MNKEEQLQKIRHSLAHLLAASVLEFHPDAKPTIGPAIDDGFYYDFEFSTPFSDKDLEKVENKMRELIKNWTNFTHEVIDEESAKKRFAENPYKLELIDEIVKKGEKITLYTSGTFTDLCRGGHVENPSKDIAKDAFKLTRIAGAYWRGDEKNKMLTRIYGIAFSSKAELEAYEVMMAEAIKRDHKKLGKELGILMFHETAPGMPYWLPNGVLLYNTLVDFWREEHTKLGYKEISSPLVNKSDLWKISGHWDHILQVTSR